MWCVVVCDLANLLNDEAMAHLGGGVLRQKQTSKQANKRHQGVSESGTTPRNFHLSTNGGEWSDTFP